MQSVKTIFAVIISLTFFNMTGKAQKVKNYEPEWKKVDELINKKNLPKSALTEVKKIYELAKKEKQDAQIIKAAVYMISLQQENREENEIAGVKELENEIAVASQPSKSILQSLLAGMYWSYYQDHRWNMYDRTETAAAFKKEDIATWTAEDFHKKITELYLLSVKEEKILQQSKLETYDALIIKGNTRSLRPTLYDLLAHRALDYFSNDERDIKKPAYAFEINQPEAFAAAKEFAAAKFTTNDELSLYHKALVTYQKLIAFHLNDANPDALIDADINRLQFVKQNGVMNDKDLLFKKALENITKKYADKPAAAQAWYLIAQQYEAAAAGYTAGKDTTHQYDRIKAKEICEQVLKQKTQSEGWVNCYNLLNGINAKTQSFTIEKVNLPGQPFRALVNYRNIQTLYLRLVKADEKLRKELTNYYNEESWKKLLSLTGIRSWQQALPQTNDLQQHSVEIKIDALPAGEYLLITSSDADFSTKKAVLGAKYFYASNISFVTGNTDFFVLHRDNGQPMANATVQLWEQFYDYKNYKYTTQKGKQYKTDANGYFKIDRPEEKNRSNYNYMLDIVHKDDRLYLDEYLNQYYYYDAGNNTAPVKAQIFFFTDRSIYRPAQTVFFKGIALSQANGKSAAKILTNYKTTVYLYNANGEEADSLKVITNDYGSFSGKFQLPKGGLNGDFSIRLKDNESGSAEFSVEEYKRPKFYVEYEPIKGTFKVNDKIKITGLAKAYAGNNADGAKVSYRVVREPRYLYPWLFWKWYHPPTESMEIAHGETKTDKDGKFIIEFTAIPDLKVEKKFDPLFDYTVYADVTDINGETRSGETSVTVGYKSLLLNVNAESRLPADSFKNISIGTTNMAGEFEPAKVTVTVYKQKHDDRLIRNRYWAEPDQFIMSKEEYIKSFPYDEYKNETDARSWEKGEKVFEKTDSSKKDSKFAIASAKLSAGFYVVEISTKDKEGNEVKDVKYIELFDEKNNQLNKKEYLWTSTGKNNIEPGEKVSLQLGTAADNLFVVNQIDKGNKEAANKFSFLKLNNEKKKIDFDAAENDRGGYGVNYFFVKHNRFFFYNQDINVPWTNKELQIEYATFRDKVLPGSEEKWKVKITGYKKEKAAAEMLVSMYDASLDQFRQHDWYQPTVWPYYSGTTNWNGRNNFGEVQSQAKYNYDTDYKSFDKRYDELFQAGPGNRRGPYKGEKYQMMRMAAPVMEMEQRSNAAPAADSTKLKSSGYIMPFSLAKTNGIMTDRDGQPEKKESAGKSPETKIRKNFNETAFFFPDLRTDSSGAIEFSFTIPEALTKWKLQTLAHTKELAFGISSKEVITQKDLMVQPNAPRFLREGDKIEFSSKIVNLTAKEITGTASLELFDAATNQPVDGWFNNMQANQYFTIGAGQSEAISFPLAIPYQFNKALVWRIVAKAGANSDGEEAALPVLTNRMLVTETMSLPMRGYGTKNFKFEKLINSGSSETIQNHALTLEYTSNPAWYAVQALPYLMEYPYECAEQTWNRYYANSIAAKIANSSPRIKEIFTKWAAKDKGSEGALLSNLQKNEELKAVLLEETPWVLEAKTEAEQKKNIGLLFDMIKMSEQLNSAMEKLKQMQSENGGFVWFKGGPDNRYITQYIVTGIGHLKKIKASPNPTSPRPSPKERGDGSDDLKSIVEMAIPYLDRMIKKDYDELKKYKTDMKKYVPGYDQVGYLYMRSFFPEYKIAAASQTAYSYFRTQAQKTWVKQSKYMQGMLALALHRTADAKTPADILKSLKETSITNEELGMYWKDLSIGGWFWYQAPIETQSLLIEAFQEIGKDNKTVDDLRTWLLKNKQTTNWKTTKATAEACYALLLQGTEWLSNEPVVEIKLGNTTVSSKTDAAEAGTAYFKKSFEGAFVKPEMGNIIVKVESSKLPPPNDGGGTSSWGGIYWQYFEDLDKITTASTPLKLVKKLFIEKNTDRGPVLTPVNEGDKLKVGDKIKVRVELRVDRDMEYVHMKDMRAGCMEPVNVLSGYRWQGGLGYYETTKDASTNFFFDYLRKGTYVFEYALFVTNKGNFSNGITTIQCMYAPEFSSHSEGIRVTVE